MAAIGSDISQLSRHKSITPDSAQRTSNITANHDFEVDVASSVTASPLSSSLQSPSPSAFMPLNVVIATTPPSSLDGCETCTSPPSATSSKANEDAVVDNNEMRNSPNRAPQRPILTSIHMSYARTCTTAPLAIQSRPTARATESALDRGHQDPLVLARHNKKDNTNNCGKINQTITATLAEPSTSLTAIRLQPLPLIPPADTSTAKKSPPENVACESIIVSPSATINASSTRSKWDSQNIRVVPGIASLPFELPRPKATPTLSQQPTIFCAPSSHENPPLCQPVPGTNTRSSVFAGSIAQLEASAERLSMTDSIDDAIREEHQELKRSDSRRSSILAASIRHSAARTASHSSISSAGGITFQARPTYSRPNSIIELNTARRTSGFTIHEQVMSLASSVSGVNHLQPGSATGSIENDSPLVPTADLPVATNEGFPFVSRHGPGNVSVRSNRSGHRTLPEIVETEPPVTLTQDALDEADRLIATGASHDDDDDTIRASAHQHVDTGHDHDQVPYESEHSQGQQERPKSTASGGTYEQAQVAFGDFDGVHCDPDTTSDYFPAERTRKGIPLPTQPVPTSFADNDSGRPMQYYPARVPAVLQLPPKLSKNAKSGERINKRSQVLSMIGQADAHPKKEQHQSRSWLPDPLADIGSFSMDAEYAINGGPPAVDNTPSTLDPNASPGVDPSGATEYATTDTKNLRRPPRLAALDKRKLRLSGLGNVPPQLRASAFFDMPAPATEVEVKNGSAMDTLDSMLDAAATAPVSAFTDHAFAGTLGAEVYGPEKKVDNKSSVAVSGSMGSSQAQLSSDQEGHTRSKKGPFTSLVGHIRKVGEPTHRADEAQPVTTATSRRDLLEEDGNELPVEVNHAGNPILDKDGVADVGSDDEKEPGEDQVYQGAPTTLLAELQLRKQQQKLRTQPTYKTFPNGMHSTLLELDTVAEIERKARKGKKVNLAWEDSAGNPDDKEDDDEDVPLGVLYAAKVAGYSDVSAMAAEMNRPLGLMEKRELEDNEPLSSRRNRLQSGAGISIYLAGAGNFGKHQSMLSLMPSPAASCAIGAVVADSQENSVDEREDEPLTARLRRIKAKEESELPRARPVSTSFSTELLSQFGDADVESKGKGKAKEAVVARTQPLEEEETLGQRRRRLQAEKESREQEMLHLGNVSAGPAFNSQALEALTGGGQLSHRLSMANMLGAHPLENARGKQDPRLGMGIRAFSSTAAPSRVGGGYGSAYGTPISGNFGRQSLAVPVPGQPRGQIDRVERWRQSVLP